MIIKLDKNISTLQKEQILLTLQGHGFYLQENGQSSIIRLAGNSEVLPKEKIENLPGVEVVIDSDRSYHLVTREYRPENTVIKLGGVSIGGGEPLVIAGPCAVESEDQILRTARLVQSAGVKIMRGGAYKPRTSPYSFTGLEEKGLQLLSQARQETGVLIITEVLDTGDIGLVMLKRGMSATLEEFLGSAEYIISGGNENIILCERGIRTFVDYSRNTLDLNIVPVIKKISHLPIIVDPSHGTGRRDIIEPMSLAALAAGADGIMVEVHPDPPASWSDPDQALYPDQFRQLMEKINQFIKWRKNAAVKSGL